MRWRKFKVLFMRASIPDAGKGRGKEGDSTGCDVAKKLFSKCVPMQCTYRLQIYATSHYDQFALFLSPRYWERGCSRGSAAGLQYPVPLPFQSVPVFSPAPGSQTAGSSLAISEVSSRETWWAAGQLAAPAGHSEPLILHYCRCCRCAGDKIKCSRNDIWGPKVSKA